MESRVIGTKQKFFFLNLEIFIYLELTNQDPFQIYSEPTTYFLNLGLIFLKTYQDITTAQRQDIMALHKNFIILQMFINLVVTYLL